MFDDPLPDEIRQMLINRYEGYEIVELLGLTAEETIEACLDLIVDKLDLIREELGLNEEDEDGTE